jgi:hypothetical protein
MDTCTNGLIIKLPHTKKEINGFGYSELSSIFWWFGDNKNNILYHYKYDGGHTQTQYLDLPEGVTKENYNILGYLEESNSLILELKK